MAQYLDKTGLQYYHSKITAYVNNKTANMLTKALADTYYAPKDVAATQSTIGLMSAADKKKLDGIAEKANNYVLPTATATVLGGVKSTTTGTTANRNYNVLVNSDGTMKVNVPWVDTNTTYSVATTSSNGLMSKDDKWAFNAICTYLAQSSASVVDSAINPEVWSICTFNGATVVPSSQISTGTVPVTPSAVVVWDGTTGTFVTRTGDDSAYAYYSTVDRSYGTASDTGAVPFENHIYVNVANDYSLHMYIGGVMTKISPTAISNSEIDTIFA